MTAPRLSIISACMAAGLLLVGCGSMGGGTEVPSAPPPPTSPQERSRGAGLYRDGIRALNPSRGGVPDPGRAAILIEAAAALGDPDAQLMVGSSHLFRPDGGRDAAAAIPWLHRSAQQGTAEAQFRLGQLIEAGDGTSREPAWAAVWFQRAAERGHPEAHFAMALLQVAGEGTAQDDAEALARLRISERRGVAAARRYREALQRRVPAVAARHAESRLAGETSRGPVPPVDRPIARFAQSGLATQGLWTAPVNGRDGPQTRAALTAFARREGIPAAMPYDPAIITRLRERLRPG